jgi:hypothetical protein
MGSPPLRPTAAALLALSLAAALAACGGSGSETSATTPAGTASADRAAPPAGRSADRSAKANPHRANQAPPRSRADRGRLTGQRRRAASALRGFYALLATARRGGPVDFAALCERLSRRVRERFATVASRKASRQRDLSCAKGAELLLGRKRTGAAPPGPPRVLWVELHGDRATASVRFGDRPPARLHLVREGGAWRLDRPAPHRGGS